MAADTPLDDIDLTPAQYRLRLRDLEARLEEAEETVSAIRRGDFDAVVVEGPTGERLLYTLENADRPYRVLIEQIQEGAFTLGADGTVLYCNQRLAEMLGTPQERVIGFPLQSFLFAGDVPLFVRLLEEASEGVARGELLLARDGAIGLPVNLSLSQLHREEAIPLLYGVLTDLSEQRLHLRELADANDRLRTEAVERERIEEAQGAGAEQTGGDLGTAVLAGAVDLGPGDGPVGHQLDFHNHQIGSENNPLMVAVKPKMVMIAK